MKNRNVFLGAILIVLGLLWILSNLNLFDYNMRYLLSAFRDLWPLIIILVGAGLILQNKVAERILWVLFLLVLVGYSIFLQVGNPFSNAIDREDGSDTGGDVPIVETYTYPLSEDTTKGNLEMRIGATRFTMSGISSDHLLELDTTMDNLYVDVSDGNEAAVEINNRGDWIDLGDSSQNRLDLNLNKNLPWTIQLECGAIEADLDLSSLSLERMDLSLGAGDLSLRLGNQTEHTVLNMKSGVSQVDLYLPQDAALVIHMSGALNDTNIDTLGLTKEGNTYISSNANGSNTIELNLEMGLGQLIFHRY